MPVLAQSEIAQQVAAADAARVPFGQRTRDQQLWMLRHAAERVGAEMRQVAMDAARS